jgi:hypothetical protein
LIGFRKSLVVQDKSVETGVGFGWLAQQIIKIAEQAIFDSSAAALFWVQSEFLPAAQ